MRVRRPAFILLGVLVAAPLVWAAVRHVRAGEAMALAREAAIAHERVGYAGTVAWRSTCWDRPMRVTHDPESGRTRYRSSRRWDFTTHGPSSRTPDPAGWCLDADALAENYRAEELDETRFLDRPARLVVLRPRYGGRPTVHLTLDEDTRLPLRVVTFRPDGTLYRVAAFREVEIAPQEVPPRRGPGFPDWYGRTVPVERVEENAGFAPLEPDYLPPGFRCISRRVAGRIAPRVRCLFSDGLTAFELSQHAVATPAQMEASFQESFGPERARRALGRYLAARRRVLASADANGEEGDVVVRRRKFGAHRSYELRVGRIDAKLSTRSDLDREETLKVLRSLRAR